MAKIEGECKEVLEKTEWVAIVTSGTDGPHSVATWGDYIRAIGLKDDMIIIPAGGYQKTEENLKKNSRVELLIASKQVPSGRSIGKGFSLIGTGEVQTAGEFSDLAKAKFSWARGALVVKVREVHPLI